VSNFETRMGRGVVCWYNEEVLPYGELAEEVDRDDLMLFKMS
jgi:hypothetical protein